MVTLAATRYFLYLFKNLNIREAIREAINMHPDQIESLLKDQLQDGISSTGDRIRPEYAKETVKRKQKKGQPYDRVTLRDEGDFYRSIFLETFPDAFGFDANDFKKPFLVKRYEPKSGKILSLTKENIKDVAAIIKPTLEKLLLEKIKNLQSNVSKETLLA